MPGRTVFISYRRGADSDAAARLSGLLEKRYGAESVFFDVDSIPAGVDFSARLTAQLADCGAFVPVIGPAWTDAIGRLQDSEDFVRLEIEAAFARGNVPVLPVLVQGAKMPSAEDLPDSLGGLPSCNAITAPHDQFSAVINGALMPAIDGVVDQSRTKDNMPVAWMGTALFIAAVVAFGIFALTSL